MIFDICTNLTAIISNRRTLKKIFLPLQGDEIIQDTGVIPQFYLVNDTTLE